MVISRSAIASMATGFLVGLVIWLFYTVGTRYPAIEGLILIAVLVSSVNVLLLGSHVFKRGTYGLLLGLTSIITAISAWVYWDDGNDGGTGSWFIYAVVINYIGIVFILSWPIREGRFPRYEDLFRHAWDTVFIVLLGFLLIAVFWLLLMLCTSLFTMISMLSFSELFKTGFFIAVSSCTVFALGVHIGRENHQVIGMLRNILLTICRYLLPLASIMTLMFTVVLPFAGHASIGGAGYSTKAVMYLVLMNMFLLNGVFQDGNNVSAQGSMYPTGLQRMVNVSLLCLPILMLLAAYSLWLRVDQYGLTPRRFKACLMIAVMLVYSVSVAWAVLTPQRLWLWRLRVTNPLIALLSGVLLLAINTPLLSPNSISANNQFQRLLNGKTTVETFDVFFLYRHLGQPGRRVLSTLVDKANAGEGLTQRERAVLLLRLQYMTPDKGNRADPLEKRK